MPINKAYVLQRYHDYIGADDYFRISNTVLENIFVELHFARIQF